MQKKSSAIRPTARAKKMPLTVDKEMAITHYVILVDTSTDGPLCSAVQAHIVSEDRMSRKGFSVEDLLTETMRNYWPQMKDSAYDYDAPVILAHMLNVTNLHTLPRLMWSEVAEFLPDGNRSDIHGIQFFELDDPYAQIAYGWGAVITL